MGFLARAYPFLSPYIKFPTGACTLTQQVWDHPVIPAVLRGAHSLSSQGVLKVRACRWTEVGIKGSRPAVPSRLPYC